MAALVSPLMPFLALLGMIALVAVALAIAFPGAVLPRLAAFFDQLLAAREQRRRLRSTRLARRIPR